MSRIRRRTPALLIAVLATGGLVVAPATASSSPTAGETVPWADPLLHDLTLLAERAATDLKSSNDQFGGAEISQETGSLQIYWKGEIPEELNAVVAKAGERNPSAKVAIEPSRFSLSELEVASEQLTEATSNLGARVIEIRSDGSGLQITAPNIRSKQGELTQAGLQINETVSARSDKSIPVTVGGNEYPETSSRSADTSPYYGGAVIKTPAGSVCSDAFGAYDNNGTRYMITAAHCSGYADGVVEQNGTGVRMGVTSKISSYRANASKYDLALITLDYPKQGGLRMFDGGVGTGEFSKPVYARANYLASGTALCASGAKTGARCGLASGSQVNACYDDGQCSIVVRVTASSGIVWAKGDSGGPVFDLNPSNGSQVRAQGVVSGIYNAYNCPQYGTGNNCSGSGYTAAIGQVFQQGVPGLNFTINTTQTS